MENVGTARFDQYRRAFQARPFCLARLTASELCAAAPSLRYGLASGHEEGAGARRGDLCAPRLAQGVSTARVHEGGRVKQPISTAADDEDARCRRVR